MKYDICHKQRLRSQGSLLKASPAQCSVDEGAVFGESAVLIRATLTTFHLEREKEVVLLSLSTSHSWLGGHWRNTCVWAVLETVLNLQKIGF